MIVFWLITFGWLFQNQNTFVFLSGLKYKFFCHNVSCQMYDTKCVIICIGFQENLKWSVWKWLLQPIVLLRGWKRYIFLLKKCDSEELVLPIFLILYCRRTPSKSRTFFHFLKWPLLFIRHIMHCNSWTCRNQPWSDSYKCARLQCLGNDLLATSTAGLTIAILSSESRTKM